MLRLGPRNWAAGFEGRRWFSSGAPDMPLAAAANAAMLLAAVELMLFLRVTRWAGFIEAADSECECGRDLGSEPAMELEWRCWVEGRTAMGSLRTVMVVGGLALGRPSLFVRASEVGDGEWLSERFEGGRVFLIRINSTVVQWVVCSQN